MGIYVAYFIAFSVGFAVLRNMFGRVYQHFRSAETKPIDWRSKFRRATNEKKETKSDQKESFLKDEEIGHSPSSGEPKKVADSFDPNSKRMSRFSMKVNDEPVETVDLSDSLIKAGEGDAAASGKGESMTNAVYNGLNKFYEMRKGQMENKVEGPAKIEVKSSYDYQTLPGEL